MATLVRSTIASTFATTILGMVPTLVLADDAPRGRPDRRCAEQAPWRASRLSAIHAKGIVVEGSFKASPEAAPLGLQQVAVVHRRDAPGNGAFFDSCGRPMSPMPAGGKPAWDGDQFHLPGSGESDIVVNAFKIFLVATAEDFRDRQMAAASTPPDRRCPPGLRISCQPPKRGESQCDIRHTGQFRR